MRYRSPEAWDCDTRCNAHPTSPLGSRVQRFGASTLILGLGNDILTDDAIGLLVVRQLERELSGDFAFTFRETTEMGLALLDTISGFGSAVIVDSIQTSRAEPGFVHEVDAAALTSLTGRTPHFLGVAETLALGRQLGLPMPDDVRIFAIEVADPFTLGMELTPALRAAFPGIVARISAALRGMEAHHPPLVAAASTE